MAGPRFFGIVIGGALPAATAADMLAAGWDQCAFNAVLSPAAMAAEAAAGGWLKELLGIPAGASVGFVTGAQAANTSRRARGFAVWAALRELGRDGVAELVERCCRLARRFADGLPAAGGEVVNDVVLNQVLVSFGDDARTERMIEAIQRDGTCWMGGTTWRGRRLMRVSVSNFSTTEADVDRSLTAIRRLAGVGS